MGNHRTALIAGIVLIVAIAHYWYSCRESSNGEKFTVSICSLPDIMFKDGVVDGRLFGDNIEIINDCDSDKFTAFALAFYTPEVPYLYILLHKFNNNRYPSSFSQFGLDLVRGTDEMSMSIFLMIYEKYFKSNIHFVDAEYGNIVSLLVFKDAPVRIVEDFLRSGVSADTPGYNGLTPLVYASYWEKYEYIPVLLEYGANPKRIVSGNDGTLQEISACYLSRINPKLKPFFDCKD